MAGYFYQWYFNGSLIPGATSFEYDATFAGEYYVVIDNGDGCSATSETVEITSSGPAALVTLDGPANICNSGSVTMTTITGAGYLYQWYKDGSPIAGATTNTYTTSELGAYFVNINVDGCTSTPVTINVINETPESVTNALGDLDICESGSVSLTCTTSGVGYSFQWLKDDEAIPGAAQPLPSLPLTQDPIPVLSAILSAAAIHQRPSLYIPLAQILLSIRRCRI